jgi:hypothetical protein
MERQITIRFSEEKQLDEIDIRSVRGLIGLYFIYLVELRIPYPIKSSRLIYIGMSESKQNSIGNRLRDHTSGQSGNPGLTNYIAIQGAQFTFLSQDFLTVLGDCTPGEVEGIFLRSFRKMYGCHPICNNQSGIELESPVHFDEIQIDWKHFE